MPCSSERAPGRRWHTDAVADTDVLALNLDVYDTNEGLWNPEHGSLELPDGWEFLPAGDT